MATSQSSPNKLVLEANIPQVIALKYRNGKECESRFTEEKQVMYTLTDNRIVFLPLTVSNAIANLRLDLSEPFNICKYNSNQKGKSARINVWYTPEGEQSRAIEEQRLAERGDRSAADPSYLVAQLDASIAVAQARRIPPQPALTPPRQRTGTDGPVAVPRQTMPAQALATPTPVQEPIQGAPAVHNGTAPKTKLEGALKTAVAAAYAATEYAKAIGYAAMPQFTAEDIRTMANTLIIDGQRNGGGR